MIKQKIDLTKITGAKRMMSQSGRDILVVDLAASRCFMAQSGAVYLDVDCVERKEVGQYGDTHFLSEAQTKEERAAREKSNIIGNGKELMPMTRPNVQQAQHQQPQQRQQYQRPSAQPQQGYSQPNNDEDIPF